MTPYFGIVVSLAAFGTGTFLFKNQMVFLIHASVCRDDSWDRVFKNRRFFI